MASETSDFAAVFERYRKYLAEALAALPPEALNWRPPVKAEGDAPLSNTPAAIATHVAGAQRYWIGEVIGGVPAQRDRDAEFRAAAAAAGPIIEHLNATGERVQAVLAGLGPADLEQTVVYGGETITRRRLIMRMLAHTAEHWGELMLIRQLWEARAQP
jgi:hypothetical protein